MPDPDKRKKRKKKGKGNVEEDDTLDDKGEEELDVFDDNEADTILSIEQAEMNTADIAANKGKHKRRSFDSDFSEDTRGHAKTPKGKKPPAFVEQNVFDDKDPSSDKYQFMPSPSSDDFSSIRSNTTTDKSKLCRQMSSRPPKKIQLSRSEVALFTSFGKHLDTRRRMSLIQDEEDVLMKLGILEKPGDVLTKAQMESIAQISADLDKYRDSLQPFMDVTVPWSSVYICCPRETEQEEREARNSCSCAVGADLGKYVEEKRAEKSNSGMNEPVDVTEFLAKRYKKENPDVRRKPSDPKRSCAVRSTRKSYLSSANVIKEEFGEGGTHSWRVSVSDQGSSDGENTSHSNLHVQPELHQQRSNAPSQQNTSNHKDTSCNPETCPREIAKRFKRGGCINTDGENTSHSNLNVHPEPIRQRGSNGNTCPKKEAKKHKRGDCVECRKPPSGPRDASLHEPAPSAHECCNNMPLYLQLSLADGCNGTIKLLS